MINSKLIIIGGIAILMLASIITYAGYSWGYRNAENSHLDDEKSTIEAAIRKVETEYQAKMVEKDKVIAARDAQISRLRKDYQNIIERLKGKAAEAKAVTPPVNDIDAKQRLEALGYKPK